MLRGPFHLISTPPLDDLFFARPLLALEYFSQGNAFQKFTFILRSPRNVVMLFFPLRKVILSERGDDESGARHKQFAAPPPRPSYVSTDNSLYQQLNRNNNSYRASSMLFR